MLLAAATLLACGTGWVCAGPGDSRAGRPSPAAPDYVPGEVVVGYAPEPLARGLRGRAHHPGDRRPAPSADAGTAVAAASRMQVVQVPAARAIWQAIARLRRQRGVAYAVPDYIAHQAGGWIPNDPGKHPPCPGLAGRCSGTSWPAPASTRPTRGRTCSPTTGRAAAAWSSRCSTPASPTATGSRFRKSPDFGGTHFVDPYDFVANNRVPARPRGPRDVRRRNDRRGDQQPARAHRAGLRREDHAGPGARRRRQRRLGDDRARDPLRGQARRPGDQPEPRVRHHGHRVGDPRHHQRDQLRPPPRGGRGGGRRQRQRAAARLSRRCART